MGHLGLGGDLGEPRDIGGFQRAERRALAAKAWGGHRGRLVDVADALGRHRGRVFADRADDLGPLEAGAAARPSRGS